MSYPVSKITEHKKREERLLKDLDKAIDDVEMGRTIAHEDAIKIIREKVLKYRV